MSKRIENTKKKRRNTVKRVLDRMLDRNPWSFLVPVNELTQADIETMRQKVIKRALDSLNENRNR
jgi:hypothetical protein